MKKIIALLMILSLLLAACSQESDDDVVEDVVEIEITERFFIAQTNEIIGNPARYLGRTIRLEGMFFSQVWPATGEEFHFVFRMMEGCCGPEEPVGFELRLEDTVPPPDNTWVEVTGVLEQYVGFWQQYSLRLEVLSLTEMSERGAEFVTQ